jgi:protein-ribulosamine 3-kinase
MLDSGISSFLKELFAKILPDSVHSVEEQSIGGGSINDTYRLRVNKNQFFFLKINDADRYPGLFEKEKEGLDYLASQNTVTIPDVYYCGEHENKQLLLMEWIPTGTRSVAFWKKFGEQLANLHHHRHEQYGFFADNYMGALPQHNTFAPDWKHFFFQYRLQPQIKLATDKNLLPGNYADLFQQLGRKLGNIFSEEQPSLLHGDLWSGNFMCNDRSLPVLIDPAVYYGHRSMDLGMTILFGGFDKEFYDAYHYHFPLPSNYEEQWEVCNLYPLLIHLNLFGISYLNQINLILKKFL